MPVLYPGRIGIWSPENPEKNPRSNTRTNSKLNPIKATDRNILLEPVTGKGFVNIGMQETEYKKDSQPIIRRKA